MPWFYIQDGLPQGPLDDRRLNALVDNGSLSSQTLLWHEGMADWQPLHHVRTSLSEAAPTPPGHHTCVECRQPYPHDHLLEYRGRFICAGCKPIFFQKVQEGAYLPGQFAYAGFWIRTLAFAVDYIIIIVANNILNLLFQAIHPGPVDMATPRTFLPFILTISLIQSALYFGFYTFFHGRFGATPGKMVCGIKVVRSSGERISYLRALARTFAFQLSALLAGLGLIMAAFDDEKQALHDRLCDTRVIKP